MIKIGITGVIGSGKTTVANILKSIGITVVDADEISRNSTKKDGEAYLKIIKLFGAEILDDKGEINRERLAKIVFSDAQKKKQLENIIHPIVQKKREEIVLSLEKINPNGIVAFDIPLLFEAGLEKTVDYVLLAYADENTMFERVKNRDGMSYENFQTRLKNQMPIDEKRKKSDFVIDTRKNIELLKKEVVDLVEKIKNKLKTCAYI